MKNTGNAIPKKSVLLSKKRIKAKSKCAIYLSKMTFIGEIEDRYGQEKELEVNLQFFTD